MAVVELASLSKRYPGASDLAVDNVSLTIEDGEFMVLLGPSGCGKSTTLRMIAGLESITEGELSLDGRVINDVPAKDRDMAMVFQSYALYPHMNVRDNMAFGLRRRGIDRAEIARRVDDAARTLELSSLLDRKPYALSGGQRQRVALGRAIVRDPKVFLFDEPLSNLDAALRVSTRVELTRQHARLGTTMIYVTHDQIEAMTMGSRICIMTGGRIAQVGRPLDVYSHPADTFVARFLGSPGMNLLAAGVARSSETASLRLGEATFTWPISDDRAISEMGGNGPVVLGIRPEDLYEAHAVGDRFPTGTLRGTVMAVEPLGADTLVVVRLDGLADEITARLGRDARFRSGDPIELSADLRALRLFDSASGKALAAPFISSTPSRGAPSP